MQEYPNSSPKPQTEPQEVLYIYDRVCRKNSKTMQILQEYGTCAEFRPDAQPRTAEQLFSRPLGKAFADSQRKRAEDYFRKHPERMSTARKTAWTPDETPSSGEGTGTSSAGTSGAQVYTFTDRAGNEYAYSPGGAVAVERNFLKKMQDQVATMIESLPSRKKSEQDAAKRQAIAHKKFTENRHAFFIAFLLFLVTCLFVGFVYFAFFVISDVDVTGSDAYTAEEVVDAAGFAMGDNLYSFHAGQAEELILFHCPGLKTVQISRTLPNAVDIAISDDTAVYCADIYGDVAVLSAGLRVLGYTDAETAELRGLTKLTLPAVRDSVAGRVLTFADERDLRYVRNILTAAETSALYEEGRIDGIDISDAFNVTVRCDGKYLLRLGSEKDTALKLRMAHKTITDEAFDRNLPADIDLTSVGEASVRFDMSGGGEAPAGNIGGSSAGD